MVAGRLFVKCTGVTSSYNSIYTSFVVTRYRLIASWRVLASFILFIRPFAISSDTGVSCIVLTVGASGIPSLEKRDRE
jgi:hypothetical protein